MAHLGPGELPLFYTLRAFGALQFRSWLNEAMVISLLAAKLTAMVTLQVALPAPRLPLNAK